MMQYTLQILRRKLSCAEFAEVNSETPVAPKVHPCRAPVLVIPSIVGLWGPEDVGDCFGVRIRGRPANAKMPVK